MTAFAHHHDRPGAGGLPRLVRDLLQDLWARRRRRLERRALADLDPYIRADIGLDPPRMRADAERPVARSRAAAGRRPPCPLA